MQVAQIEMTIMLSNRMNKYTRNFDTERYMAEDYWLRHRERESVSICVARKDRFVLNYVRRSTKSTMQMTSTI